jgi:hypothetical protein
VSISIGAMTLVAALALFVSTPPAPYSLPFALRSVLPVDAVRLEAGLAISEVATTVPVLLGASKKIGSDVAVVARIGAVGSSPRGADGGAALSNLAIGASYALEIDPSVRASIFLGAALPFGSGGGDSPNPTTRAALLAAMPARSAMDNALFAVNYLTVFPGAGLAYIDGGLTLQAEATVLFLARVRGERMDADEFRLNFTSGIHAGYFVAPWLSLALELRYQHWIANDSAFAVADNPAIDNLTIAIGPRAHLDLGFARFRPGLAVAVGLDDPIGFGDRGTQSMLRVLDLPLVF